MTNFLVFRDIYRQFEMSMDNTDTNNHDSRVIRSYVRTYLLHNNHIPNFSILPIPTLQYPGLTTSLIAIKILS